MCISIDIVNILYILNWIFNEGDISSFLNFETFFLLWLQLAL